MRLPAAFVRGAFRPIKGIVPPRARRGRPDSGSEPLEGRVLLTALTSGQSVLGHVGPGERDTHTFTAPAGVRVLVGLGQTSRGALPTTRDQFQPEVEIRRPDGTTSRWSALDSAVFDLGSPAAAGNYTLRVGDRDGETAGGYRLTVTMLPGPQARGDDGPIVSGQSRVAQTGPGDIDLFTFRAQAGNTINLAAGQTEAWGPHAGLRLYGPDGALLGTGAYGEFARVTAPRTGTYYAAVTSLVRELPAADRRP